MRDFKKGDAWVDLITEDLPEWRIDVTARQKAMTNRKSRGGYRFCTGRFRTDEEYEEFRREVLGTPLP